MAGFCFPPDVIVLAVRWYRRFALSYRDVEELLAERGIEVDHVTVNRWVQRFTPLLAGAACVAFYTRRFLARHHLDPDGLRVEAGFTMRTHRPARVDTITLRLLVPQPLEPNRRRALLAVVDHCTVHNSLRTPPEVRVTLAEPAGTSPSPLATPGG